MLLGLSCTLLALRHLKSTSFGNGRSHPTFICAGCPSFGCLDEASLQPAPAPSCSCSLHQQLPVPPLWLLGSRSQAGPPPSGVWMVPGAPWHWDGPLSLHWASHPRAQANPAVPRLHQRWMGRDRALPKPDNFSGREKKTQQTNDKAFALFSSFPNTSDLGFFDEKSYSPHCLELPVGTSRLQTCLWRKTYFSLKPSSDCKSFNVKSVGLVMSVESRAMFRWENLHAAAPRDGFNTAGGEERKKNALTTRRKKEKS